MFRIVIAVTACAQWSRNLPNHSTCRQQWAHRLTPLCWAIALVGLLFGNRPVFGQDRGAATTLSVDVKVVTLPVTVRDKHGQIVRNLTKDDFLLEEDGHSQTIKYFTQESTLPLTLGLLVDTSLSQRNVLDQERTASESFLGQMLNAAKDQAFVIHFDREVELLQDLTSSRAKLQSALALLQTPKFDRDSAGSGGSSPDPEGGGSRRAHVGGGTLLYDAVFLSAEFFHPTRHIEGMQSLHERAVLLGSGHHVKGASAGVDHRRSRNPHLECSLHHWW
jgi:VWFA-related protein